MEKLRLSIPEGPGLDKLLRYEAALDRSFDRTLSQLERLQRMRLGQGDIATGGLVARFALLASVYRSKNQRMLSFNFPDERRSK